MRLRSSLLLLSVATAAPLLALSVLAGAYVFERENANVISTALARNRATLDAMEAEARGTINTLRALASSPALASGDLQAFHDDANLVLATQPHWHDVILSRPDGAQLMNARVPWGTALPQAATDPVSLRAAVHRHEPAIGNLWQGQLPGSIAGVPVRIPLQRDGRVFAVLTAVLRPDAFQQLLVGQQLPAGWVSGLVGSDGRMIARVPPVQPGSFASDDFRARVAAQPEGWYRGRTLEGRDTYTAFSKSGTTGWSIGFAMPAETIVDGPARAALLVAGGLALSIASALLIGWWLIRRIAAPITQLASAATLLGSGGRPAEVTSGIDEVLQLSRAVSAAADAIGKRDAELLRTAEELRVQAAELKDTNANRTRFLALLSHELRNPLAPLRNGIALLDSNPEPRAQSQTRAMMRRQLVHLTRLIDDLLDVGRIDRGVQVKLQLEPVLLEAAVQGAIEVAKPAMEAKNQSLVVRYSPSRTHVRGDAVRLHQVFTNLLGNASKYTQAGGRIEVGIDEEQAEALVTVADNGIGFEPADASRIFDMFVRLEAQPAAGDPGGLGIGLTLARSLVELHGGRIEAESAGAGRGATFRVRLPVCVEAGGSPQPQGESPGSGASRSVRVLVADDNVDAAQTLAELLRLEGFEVQEAHDGAEALAAALRWLPHVVFLDLGMPRLSGIDVARELRAAAPAVRPCLVALTGWGQESDVAAARAAGFDEHLTKPADPAAVVRIAALAGAANAPPPTPRSEAA